MNQGKEQYLNKISFLTLDKLWTDNSKIVGIFEISKFDPNWTGLLAMFYLRDYERYYFWCDLITIWHTPSKGFIMFFSAFLVAFFLGLCPQPRRRPQSQPCGGLEGDIAEMEDHLGRGQERAKTLSSQKQNDFGREGLFTIGLTQSGRVWKSLFSWTSMLTTSPSTAVKPLI